ncbi:phenylalanyl-tRNA synthetase alpha chain [Nematocida homosporus]|uniref:phenylalanyl-tRNA synthetase alpha chain n=1 Tax=Nematocida homosporus TaxID=1912981 RepID=UPI002220B0B1|nr:phenylalanyl-tRNA synthetase alpha chain [Nematocida homosporus]KAI5186248.1 phenylalanyl-tRNA synthetase alpha chain [Nematocida homosporus]
MSNLTSIEETIIEHLKTEGALYSSSISGDYVTVIGVVKKLESFGRIKCTPIRHKMLALTEAGELVQQSNSPEYLLYLALKKGVEMSKLDAYYRTNPVYQSMSDAEIKKLIMVGRNNGIKSGLFKVSGDSLVIATEQNEDTIKKSLANLTTLDSAQIEILKKRKMIVQKDTTHYRIEKGESFNVTDQLISDITSDMLHNLNISQGLKKYNFDIVPNLVKYSGALHPLSLERERVKSIFLQMGFEEMNAGKYVESSFWNFDALFQPQRHPSRNEQDTFFLENPSTAQDPDSEYLRRVEAVHTVGAYGSIGHQAPWSLEESRKNVLRTHTTAVTTRLLYQLAKEGRLSGKFFSIDRVFRNESLDATHLAEFHQVEGIVIGEHLTIAHLMGFLEAFFKSFGIDKIKFKPAFNPYTEPSVEVFAYHEEMKKWMEIGNSGMFRPEMLLPMGLPANVRVIGWGLSLERPVMIFRQMNNIRELVGHKVDLAFIRNGLAKGNAK